MEQAFGRAVAIGECVDVYGRPALVLACVPAGAPVYPVCDTAAWWMRERPSWMVVWRFVDGPFRTPVEVHPSLWAVGCLYCGAFFGVRRQADVSRAPVVVEHRRKCHPPRSAGWWGELPI